MICVYVHRMGIFRDHSHRGILFCDHIITIEAISVVKHNKNNSLYVKLIAKTNLE